MPSLKGGIVTAVAAPFLSHDSLHAQLQCIIVDPLRGAYGNSLRTFCLAGMIIILVPIVGALTTRFAHFDMIHLGSYLSALSPLWIVAFPDQGMLSALSVGLTKLYLCEHARQYLWQGPQ